MIASLTGRLAAKGADRVVIETAAGLGYEVTVPLDVMERLPAVGQTVTLATELVVRDDAWALYGFADAAGRRFFQRLMSVSGVGPRLAMALLSHLGAERGAKAIRDRNVALLASVGGIGKKTAERLALELADKVEELAGGTGPAAAGAADTALRALERLGYATAEADAALRQALAGNGDLAADPQALLRRALTLLTTR